jgi:hypothetical protein
LTNRQLTLALSLFALLLTPSNAMAQFSAPVSASAPPYSVRVTVLRATDPIYDVLYEAISTSDPQNHSVYCLDGLLDLEYVLRDSSGKIVPLADTWRDHVDFMMNSPPYNPKGPNGPDPCKGIRIAETHAKVWFSWLYPSLKRGTYTLQVILAPRGTTDHAITPPFTISIPNK